MRYSFFHAADLHLGAASEGVMKGAPAQVRDAVDTSTYRAFDKLIADAEQFEPAFVLFPGDLYNSADENLRARLAFRDGVIRLDRKGISSFVIRGNHDPMMGTDPLVLPGSCHVFGVKPGEPQVVSIEGEPVARIYGESYPSAKVMKNLASKYPQVIHCEDGLLQIAMLHGNLIGEKSLGSGEKNPGDYAPFALVDLEQRGYDYWALGHVHVHKVLTSGLFWAVYTGSLQGVSPRERGAKGYYQAYVDDSSLTRVEFRECDVLRWEERKIDVTGFETLNQVEAAIDADVRRVLDGAGGRPVVARMVLIGTTALDEAVRKEDFSHQMESLRASYGAESPFFWIEGWSVETRPEIDWDSIRHSESVQGFLLRLAAGSDASFLETAPDKLKAAAGRLKIELPTDEELSEALARAAERAVTLLKSGGDT
jgi:exonuclease SbcD